MGVLSSRTLLRPRRRGPQPPLLSRPARLAIYRESGPPDDPGLVLFPSQGLLEVSGHAAVSPWIRQRP